MSTAKRFGIVKMDKAERTPQGFLRVPAYLTRTGVFTYIMADGRKLRELRHPDDVFNPESLKTLSAIPLTNDHPKKLVTPESAKKDMIGWVGDDIKIDSIYLQATVTIADAKAIDDVESGKQELSCGYTADLVTEKGVYNGELYDCRQTNIVYNHVSLVSKGRAGSNVRLHLDADGASEFNEDSTNNDEEKKMPKFKIGDMEYECTPEMKDALDKWAKKNQEEMDGLKKQMSDMMPKADMDKMKGKCDALEAENTSLKTKLDAAPSDEAKINEKVKARVELITQAAKILKPEVKTDTMSDLEIKKAVVKEKFPKMDLDKKSEDYVQGIYDQAVLEADADKAAQDELNKKAKAAKNDSKDEPVSSEAKRKQAMLDAQDAWKTPAPITKKG